MTVPSPSRAGLRRLRAFTLIELIVVIVILGLLATIGAVSYKTVIDRTQTAALTATGQQFLNEAQALAAGEQADPVTVVAAAAADLPIGWTHTQGVSEARKVRLNRADGAWICVMMPTSYTQNGFVSGVGLDAADAPAADGCPSTPLTSSSGNGAEVIEPAPTVSQTPTLEPGVTEPTVTAEPTVSVAPLPAPANGSASREPGKVTLTWDAVEGASSYQVSRNGTVIANPTSAGHVDTTGVVNDQTYLYEVRAVDGQRVSEPTQIAAAPVEATWASIDTGYFHSVGVTTDGRMFAWGLDDYGQLGDGDGRSDANTPVQIPGEWKSVSTMYLHNVAISKDGGLYAWGFDARGQLGDDAALVNKYTPTRVGTASNWVSVSAGWAHSAAIDSTGKLFTWGYDQQGQLGDDSLVGQKPTPVQVAGTWSSVSAGAYHTMGVNSLGKLHTWGQDNYGQLGDGATIASKMLPTQIGTLDWNMVAGGVSHSAAITKSGELYVWGLNTDGQVGDGTLANKFVPTKITVTGVTAWKTVSAGTKHTLAVTAAGQMYAWGADDAGQLGDGAVPDTRTTPMKVSRGVQAVVSAGLTHSASITTDGRLWVWGSDASGQLGQKDTDVQQGEIGVVVY